MRNTFVSVAMLAAVLMRDFEIHGFSMRTQTDQVRRTVRTMIAVICLSRAAVIDRLRPIQRRDIDMGVFTPRGHCRPIDMACPRLGADGHKRYEQRGDQSLQASIPGEHSARLAQSTIAARLRETRVAPRGGAWRKTVRHRLVARLSCPYPATQQHFFRRIFRASFATDLFGPVRAQSLDLFRT